MKTKFLNCTLFTVTLLLTSCYSNEIYFDMEKQSVVRCEDVIKQLYISSKDGKDCLCFTVSPGKKGSKVFSLKELNTNYTIDVLNSSVPLDFLHFKLRPETEYEIINHSNGDAAEGNLLIRTDKNGAVIYANKPSCQ